MRKIGLWMTLFIAAVFFLFPGTIANIIGQKGLYLTIDQGRLDGVQIGQKGIIKAVYKDPSGEYDVNIGLFVIRKADERTAEAFVDGLGSGFKIEDARYVVFEQDLKPQVAAKPADLPPPSPPATPESHLEEGDRFFASRQYAAALESYQHALKLDPQNLVIQEKCREALRLSQMKRKDEEALAKFGECIGKADERFSKNDVKYAFLYLVEAMRVYPEGREDVQKRLRAIAVKYPRELETVLNEKKDDIKDMRSRIDAWIGGVERREAPPIVAKPKESGAMEKFLAAVQPKAKKVFRNEQGFWEALFLEDIILVYIPAGEFTLGSPHGQGDEDEHPAHKVKLGGYWLAKYETTFNQYDRFAEETGRQKPDDSGWGRGDLPVVNVSWEDAREYCSWLAKKSGLRVRLPTEAEWEKSAYGLYPWGSSDPDRTRANYNNEVGRTTAVGSYPAGVSRNGVMDLAGNVWEWVADWYAPDSYRNLAYENPQGLEGGSEKIARGGSWSNGKRIIRSANRSGEAPTSRRNIIGFRIALDGE